LEPDVRKELADEFERCRVAGESGTGPYGAFRFVHPETGRALHVIASDGRDWTECGLPGEPWEHVSVSSRLTPPRWEEMCWIKDIFWGAEEWVVQFHPAAAHYVNTHDRCLHLWAPTEPFPLPPKECV
jgi:hypothetical protein